MTAASGPVRGHVPELDGLRAFAILSVFLFHIRGEETGAGDGVAQELYFRISEAGWVGVDLFFVLSGFLITGILLDTKREPHYFKSFFARRALRILPLYYAVLVVVFIGIHLGALSGAKQAEPYYVVYLQNWLQFDPEPYRIRMLAHFWSLAIEEQFYLVWPLLIWWLSRRSIVVMCAIAILGATALRIGLVQAELADPRLVHFLTFTRVDTLATGALIAIVLRTPDGLAVVRRALLPTAAIGALGVILVVVATGRFFARTEEMVVWGYLSLDLLFAGAVIASVMLPANGHWRSVMRNATLRWIGKISYGAYVFHWPIITLMEKVWPKGRLPFWANQLAWTATIVTMTFVISALSFRIFERRFLALKERFPAS